MTFFERASGGDRAKQAGRKLAFLSLSTKFFISHFRPAVNAARMQGFELIAFLPEQVAEGRDGIRDVTVVRIGGRRAGFPFLRLFPNLYFVVLALWRNRPDVVQAFSLQACVILALASCLIPVGHRIYTITGLGLIDVDTPMAESSASAAAVLVFSRGQQGLVQHVHFRECGRLPPIGLQKGPSAALTSADGGGSRSQVLHTAAAPGIAALKIAVVSRMIWTKGIDLAVRAAAQLAEKGGGRSNSIFMAIPIRTIRKTSPEHCCSSGIGFLVCAGTGINRISAPSGGITMSDCLQAAVARGCRAPCSRRPLVVER